jgi:methyl-accepting chemotaxis protein
MFANLTIKARLIFVLGMMSALLVLVGSVGLWGMSQSNQGMLRIYYDRTVPLGQVGEILENLMENRMLVMDTVNNPSPQTIRDNRAQIDRNRQAINEAWQAYMTTTLTAEEARLAERFVEGRRVFLDQGVLPAMDAMQAGNIEQGIDLAFEVMDPAFLPIRELAADLRDLQLEVAEQEYADSRALFSQVQALAIGAIVLGLIVAAVVGYLVIQAIVRPIEKAVRLAGAIAKGDLTNKIEVQSNDEMGKLLKAMREMSDNLEDLILQVMESSGTVSIGAEEIASGNANLSQRTEQQASSLEETASSMEELTSTVKQNADNAGQANQLANAARDSAEKGGQVVAKAVTAMNEINTSSKRVADIIGVIDEIAFQTNLLALNAAVEAARAGEQGRGFAVVAAEVRSLAQRSASSAREIKDLISDSVQKVDDGAELVGASGQTLEEIVSRVKKVTDIVAEIAAASQEQSSGIEQVNKAVMQLDELTQQNAALVEEASAASQSMSEQARSMSELIQRYKVTRVVNQRSRTPTTVGNPALQKPAATSPKPSRTAAAAPAVERRSSSRPWAERTEQKQAAAKPQQQAGKATGTDDEWEEF